MPTKCMTISENMDAMAGNLASFLIDWKLTLTSLVCANLSPEEQEGADLRIMHAMAKLRQMWFMAYMPMSGMSVQQEVWEKAKKLGGSI